MNKKELAMVDSYNNATKYDIWQAYSKPSKTKVQIWDNIKSIMYVKNGYDLRITGFNSMMFSCAFRYNDENTGVMRLAYFTRYNNYDFEM